MAEPFLEEQLKRIREMTEHMTRVRDKAHEMSIETARDLESLRQGPLQQVRDLRTYSSIEEQPRDRADELSSRSRRAAPRDSARRRR
jgi:hypothetical protein